MSRTNELDKTLHLEGVYYSAPVPRSLQSLVALGFVFDRIHFPGVCLPRGDYDRKAWRAEADRIEDLGFKDPDTKLLVAAMRLSSYADVLDGFCSF